MPYWSRCCGRCSGGRGRCGRGPAVAHGVQLALVFRVREGGEATVRHKPSASAVTSRTVKCSASVEINLKQIVERASAFAADDGNSWAFESKGLDRRRREDFSATVPAILTEFGIEANQIHPGVRGAQAIIIMITAPKADPNRCLGEGRVGEKTHRRYKDLDVQPSRLLCFGELCSSLQDSHQGVQ